MIYNIKIDLPDDIWPMTTNNDRLADNEGDVMVKDVDEEAEFEDAEEKEVQPPPHNNLLPLHSTSCSSSHPLLGTHHNLAGV